jgi:vacuolar-type H+-ATPase subunit C/Vma6
MGLVDYAYANTRLRVMKSQLLSESELESFTRAKNLDDFVDALKQTHYNEVFSGMENVDEYEVEKVLRLDLLQTIRKVTYIVPPSCEPFVETLARKYEFSLIKQVLNSQAGKVSAEAIEAKLPVGGSEDLFSKGFEEMITKIISLSIADIATLLKRRYPDLDDFLGEPKDKLAIFLALDQYYFASMRKAIGAFSGQDRKTAAMLAALETDCANIMMLFRATARGYDPMKFMIPGKGHYLKIMSKYVANDVEGVMRKLSSTRYGRVLAEPFALYAKTKSFFPMELALKMYIVKQSRLIMARHPFSIDYMLGYVKLKEMEVEDLTAICVSIGEKMPAEKIGGVLISGVK